VSALSQDPRRVLSASSPITFAVLARRPAGDGLRSTLDGGPPPAATRR
jgi:hypothetical protein